MPAHDAGRWDSARRGKTRCPRRRRSSLRQAVQIVVVLGGQVRRQAAGFSGEAAQLLRDLAGCLFSHFALTLTTRNPPAPPGLLLLRAVQIVVVVGGQVAG